MDKARREEIAKLFDITPDKAFSSKFYFETLLTNKTQNDTRAIQK